jgi:hypothetical protein
MYQTVDIGDALMKEIFALVLGLILFISGYLTTKKREKRMRSGSTATGTIHEVVQKEEDPEDQLYYPVIRFVTADEEWIVKRYQTGGPYSAYQEGDQVTVIYNKSNPAKFMLDDPKAKVLGLVLTVVGSAAIVLSVAFMIFYLMIA